MPITTEEALKMQIESLKEQLRIATEALEAANEEIAKIKANEAERLKVEIIEESEFKPVDLENKTVEDLYLIKVSLDRAGARPKSAGVKKSIDKRKNTEGLTVGRYDTATKKYVGGA